MSQTRILELAQIISTNTTVVDKYFKDHNIPTPSFGIDAPRTVTIPPHEKEASLAQMTVVDATRELKDLMLGPVGMKFDTGLTQGVKPNDLVVNQAIHRFDIARCFPVGEEITYEALSKKCGLDVMVLRRFMRHAILGTRTFEEDPVRGTVRHNVMSRMIAEDEGYRDLIGIGVDELFPASCRVVDALEKFGAPKTSAETGYALAHNSQKGLYETINTSPARAKQWAGAMSYFARQRPQMEQDLVQKFDWKSFGKAAMVDVGGNMGAVSIAVAKEHPEINCTVQDFPDAVAEGSSNLPSELKDRVKFEVYDIMEPQTLKHADIYFLRAVFHNYPDASCLEIMKNQILAMKKGTHILINEGVSPGTSAKMTEFQKRFRTNIDLHMFTYFGARDREPKDYVEMFKEADPRFEENGLTMISPMMYVLDIVWTGEDQ